MNKTFEIKIFNIICCEFHNQAQNRKNEVQELKTAHSRLKYLLSNTKNIINNIL